MVVFHTIVDLTDFFSYGLSYLNGFWYYEGKLSAILFMLISGISGTMGRNSLRRGLIVLAAGMAITAVTYIYNQTTYIRFGILHLLACGILSYPLINKLPPGYLGIGGFLCITAGNLLGQVRIANPCLLPLGLVTPNFVSLDYYPLLPWYGVILIGAATGKLLYPEKQPLFPRLPLVQPISSLQYLGRHSLLIYLIHQPVLLAVLYVIHSI